MSESSFGREIEPADRYTAIVGEREHLDRRRGASVIM
jgi:hypothetical protein